MSNAEKFDAEKTVDQANITSSESDFDINELGKSVLDYLLKSLNQITLGNFTEDVTLLGTIGQILLGIFDVDILCDIRDLIADFDKLGTDEKVPIWQWALDIIALLPVIGAVKYTDEAAVLFKQADKIGNSGKHLDELDELMKHADEFSDVGKNADEAGEVSKYADELDDAGKGGKGGNDKGGSIKKSGFGSVIKKIQSKSPQQLIEDGWEDITNSKMAANTNSREFYDPKSGLKIRFDKGVDGANGFEAVDHYHVMNPNYTNKKVDYYLDIDGKPVGKGSKASNIVIKGEE